MNDQRTANDDIRETLRVNDTVIIVATGDTIFGSVRKYVSKVYQIDIEDCDLSFDTQKIENRLRIFTCDVKDPIA